MKRILRYVITLAIVMVLVVIGTTVAFAESETAVETPESVSYTIVTDSANLLSSSQISEIESVVNSLGEYKAALYIENTDKSVSTQNYATQLSEKHYSTVFGDRRDGIVIAFSFYSEANGYYGVHYGANVQINESKVKQLIEGSYHDYPTDSEWVTGSFKNCVSYFAQAEKSKTNQTSQTSSGGSDKILAIVAIIILIVTLVCIIIVLVYEMQKSSKSYKAEIEKLKKNKDDAERRYRELANIRDSIDTELQTVKKWKNDALKIDSTLDWKILDMRARQKAKEFNNECKYILTLAVTTDNFNVFNKAVEKYDKMSAEEKRYVNIDIKKLKTNRQAAAELYAKEAEEKIQDACKHYSADRHYRYEWDSTVSYYNSLPLFVQGMIAHELIINMRMNRDMAKRDWTRYRSEQDSYYSSSSDISSFSGGYSGGGSFGGSFGGGH